MVRLCLPARAVIAVYAVWLSFCVVPLSAQSNSVSSSKSPTPSKTITRTGTSSITPSKTSTWSGTPSKTPTGSLTNSATWTGSNTVSKTGTWTSSITPTGTQSATLTRSITPSPSVTRSVSASATITRSPTPSNSVTRSQTASRTSTSSSTPSGTSTHTPSPTASLELQPMGCGSSATDGTGQYKSVNTADQYPCSDIIAVAPAYGLAGFYFLFACGIGFLTYRIRRHAKAEGKAPPKLKETFAIARTISEQRRSRSMSNPKLDNDAPQTPTASVSNPLHQANTLGRTPVSTPFPASRDPGTPGGVATPRSVETAGAAAMPGFTPKSRPLVEAKFYMGVLIYLLIATIILAVALPQARHAITVAVEKYAKTTNQGANSVSENSYDPMSRYMHKVTDALTGIMYGAYLHLLLAPVIILLKLTGCLQKRRINYSKGPGDPAPTPFVLFAMKMSCKAKVIGGIINSINSIVMLLIRGLAYGGLDLSVFYFPAPFIQFWNMKANAKALRIDGRRLYFDATWHDVYLFYVYDRAMNFMTLTLWDKVLSKGAYAKWLDSRLEWRDPPPPGANSNFVFFSAKPPFCTKCVYNSCIRGLCMPFSWVYVELKLHEARLANMRFGDKKVVFSPAISFCEWFCAYYCKSVGGFCGCWRSTLDKHLAWAPDANPPANNGQVVVLGTPFAASPVSKFVLPAGATFIMAPAVMGFPQSPAGFSSPVSPVANPMLQLSSMMPTSMAAMTPPMFATTAMAPQVSEDPRMSFSPHQTQGPPGYIPAYSTANPYPASPTTVFNPMALPSPTGASKDTFYGRSAVV